MKTEHYESRVDSASARKNYREKWLHQLKRARRVYCFQRWADQRGKRRIKISEVIQWAYLDIRHIAIWNVNSLLQIRSYGSLIKKIYGLSYLKQWYRMAYLVVVIRTQATSFRLNHFFDQRRWGRVKDFAFNRHIKVHNKILGYPNHDELEILAHKLKFFEYCNLQQLQTPKILAVFEGGKVTLPSTGMFNIPENDLFVKELTGGMGRGAAKFSYQHGGYYDRNGKAYTKKNLITYLEDYSTRKNSMLVQYALKNHSSWEKFTSGGLASCRIVTGVSHEDKREVIPFFASMKMPTGNNDIDNFSKGSLVASVDIQSGIMTSAITFKPKNGIFGFDAHPDTGHPIKGETLPFWNELIEFVKNFHKHFQTLCIGWDVSLTESGFCVLEGNVEWGSDIIEAPANCPLADTIYAEWFDGWATKMKGKEIIPYKKPRY